MGTGENGPRPGRVFPGRSPAQVVSVRLGQRAPDSADLLSALAAVREALDIPNAGTMGDEEIRNKIFMERAGHAVAMLRGILGRDTAPDIPWLVAYLRDRLAENPAAGYQTWDERMAELNAQRKP